MPLLHCTKCMHEWEGTTNSKCFACGAEGYILQEKTSFEVFAEEYVKLLVEESTKRHKETLEKLK